MKYNTKPELEKVSGMVWMEKQDANTENYKDLVASYSTDTRPFTDFLSKKALLSEVLEDTTQKVWHNFCSRITSVWAKHNHPTKTANTNENTDNMISPYNRLVNYKREKFLTFFGDKFFYCVQFITCKFADFKAVTSVMIETCFNYLMS